MEFDYSRFQDRAHFDLTKRAKGGIVIYLLAWLAITLPNAYPDKFALFFYFNTAIFTLVLVSRLMHLIVSKKPGLSTASLNFWIISSILVGGLHWGMLTFWTLVNPEYSDISGFLLIAAASMGTAGTIILSISPLLRRYFPAAMLGPLTLGLIYRGDTQDIVLALMAVLAFIYALVSSKTASQDYWMAITNQQLVEERAQQMEQLSITDQLTGLNNRSYFDQRFSEEWKRGHRQRTPVSILMLDLDHFKSLNDTYGHVFGDETLQRVARVIMEIIHRETDLVARYGGEEFVALLPDTNATGAALVAEKLRHAISATILEHEDRLVEVTCSIGGASMLPDFSVDRQELLKHADKALYQAKENGRNRYQAAPALLLDKTSECVGAK